MHPSRRSGAVTIWLGVRTFRTTLKLVVLLRNDLDTVTTTLRFLPLSCARLPGWPSQRVRDAPDLWVCRRRDCFRALLAATAEALVARLTSIPLGPGTATITWTGKTGVTPTINSIKGAAGGYAVSATGRVPKPGTLTGTASSIPSEYPIANVKGTIGGSTFTLNIVISLPSSLTSNAPQTVGHVNGTFRNQPVFATLSANVNSNSFAFAGTIGTLHVRGTVSKLSQHGHSETAHAAFVVSR